MKSMIIGITGSSGAGKSTICEILQKNYQAKIINADAIAKQLSKKGTPYLSEIVEEFGPEILLENGELNRRKLANLIYHNKEKRKSLNQCTFKYIREEIKKEIQNSKCQQIVIDAPLLFEANLEKLCDVTIAVITKRQETQIARIMERDGIDEEHAKARLNAQHSNEFYLSRSKYYIVNEESVAEVKQQVEEILSKIRYCANNFNDNKII